MMVKTKLNGKYDLILPEHRAARPEWITGWEVERIEAMMADLSAGDTVFDIGAEEGDISALLAQKIGPTGRMVLFEPNPKVWPNIKAIWEANELRQPCGYYVGFASDVTDENPPNLNVDQEIKDGWPVCAYGPLIGDHGFRHLAQEADATPQITIDEYCERTGIYPTLITMDIEGAELRALQGARNVLATCKPVVYVSVHPPVLKELYNSTPAEIDNYMYSLGYRRDRLATDHEVHERFIWDEAR